MENFQVAPIQLAPKGARTACFAAAAGGAARAPVGRRTVATAATRRSATPRPGFPCGPQSVGTVTVNSSAGMEGEADAKA